MREKTPEDDLLQSSSPACGSPFKEIMQTLDRPPTADFTSPPRSADYIKKPSFFQSFSGRIGRSNFRLPRSASMRTPSPPPGLEQRSPPPSKPLSSPSTSFQALSRIRRSFRDTGSTSSSGSAGTRNAGANSAGPWSPKRFSSVADSADPKDKELFSLKEDLQAARDESGASKEVIALLRRQVDALQKEKETLSELQKADLTEGQLLEILRTKDCQIVDLEARDKEHTKITELQENQLEKLKEEVKTYQHMLEVSCSLFIVGGDFLCSFQFFFLPASKDWEE